MPPAYAIAFCKNLGTEFTVAELGDFDLDQKVTTFPRQARRLCPYCGELHEYLEYEMRLVFRDQESSPKP